jgi:hypothetical protein
MNGRKNSLQTRETCLFDESRSKPTTSRLDWPLDLIPAHRHFMQTNDAQVEDSTRLHMLWLRLKICRLDDCH